MSATDLPTRRPRFEYSDDTDPAWSRSFPEFAFAANSISLIMPYAEPNFVRTMLAALPDLDDDLGELTEAFARQETSHHRQHRRFNNIIAEHYPSVVRVERWMDGAYGWLATRSLKFNVAFVAGSETIAYSLARWTEKHMGQLFVGADPAPATLYLWHLAEEVEHKAAAFDVFEATDGSRLRYAWASTVSVVLLMFFVWAGSLAMLKDTGRLFSPIAHLRMARWSISVAFTMLPTLFVSALPSHHPSEFVDPIWLTNWLELYDEETESLPVPGVLVEPTD